MIVQETRIRTTSGHQAVSRHVLRGARNEAIRVLFGSDWYLADWMKEARREGIRYGLRHIAFNPAEPMSDEALASFAARLCGELQADKERMTLVVHQKDGSTHGHLLLPEWQDEAALTLACLPAAGLRPAGARSTWPAYLCDLEDLGWERESDEFLPRPAAEQIDRLDVVLGWIPLIEDRQQKTVVHMRMIRHPISGENRWKWEQIGKRLGLSNHTAKARFEEACAVIARKIS